MVFLSQREEVFKQLCSLQKTKSLRNSWSITWRQGRVLSELVTLYSPSSVLELGTSLGFSTLWLAFGLDNDSSLITTLEIDEDRFELSKKQFHSLGLSSSIDAIHCDFFESSSILRKKNPFDFVFIDALQPRYMEVISFLRENHLVTDSCIFVCDNVLSHSYMDSFVLKISSQAKFWELIELDSGFLVFSF